MFFLRIVFMATCFGFLPLQVQSAREITEVFVNNIKMPVYFNDGDTFKVLDGELKGTSARVVGFNTLETYGPIHKWGDWTFKDLLQNSKDATTNARRGVWHCESDMDKDTYGRFLAYCEDLALDQVGKGLAHIMTVTKDPAREILVKAQAEAIKNKAGFWEKGVPDYIITSAHSLSEFDGGKTEKVPENERKKSYDRFVSTKDGHSVVSKHTSRYADCEEVSYLPSNLADTNSTVSTLIYVKFQHRYGRNKPGCLWSN